MKQRTYLVGPLMLALWGGALDAAQAQPDPNQVPKGANPPQAQPQAPIFINPGGVLGGWIKPGGGPMPMRGPFMTMPLPLAGGPFMTMPMMPPQMQAQMLEQSVRQQLQASGFTDKALQDAVIDFMQAQEKARGPLRDKAREVGAAIRNNATTDTQMATLTNAFRIAIEDEKTRSEAALKTLDAKIGYAKKPRLEALLMMLGLIGDETSYLTSPASAMSAGGLGMPGLNLDELEVRAAPFIANGAQPAPNIWQFFGAPGNGAQNGMVPVYNGFVA